MRLNKKTALEKIQYNVEGAERNIMTMLVSRLLVTFLAWTPRK